MRKSEKIRRLQRDMDYWIRRSNAASRHIDKLERELKDAKVKIAMESSNADYWCDLACDRRRKLNELRDRVAKAERALKGEADEKTTLGVMEFMPPKPKVSCGGITNIYCPPGTGITFGESWWAL